MDQKRIHVLRKADCFFILHSPNVSEVCLKLFAGSFVGAAVLSQRMLSMDSALAPFHEGGEVWEPAKAALCAPR